LRFPDLHFGRGDVSARLAALREKPLNFDPASLAGDGWERDDYRRRLLPEAPGPPEPGGSWEIARELCYAYAFADPSLVEALFDPTVPLADREMLLILHAPGARIYAGVRVGAAGEEMRVANGREAQVAFWNYRTLEGHVEAGQRDFEVWKWLGSGEVEFRTHAVSRPAEANPVVVLGFRLLGRHKQVEFGERACARMAFLTEAAVRSGSGAQAARTLDGRLLALYLRDHHALLVAGRELAQRMTGGTRPVQQQSFALRLREAADDDLTSLETLLTRLGSAPSRTRERAVWAAEKLARLKLNGRILRPSPLSAVTELEGCRVLLECVRALWSGLAELRLGGDDAEQRARRAQALLETAELLRLDALRDATLPYLLSANRHRQARAHR
jgi:uncharacterized protein DUF1990